MPQKHSRMTENGRHYWWTERLWRLAAGLPVRSVPIASILEFDQNCWFSDDDPPTCKRVAEHAKRIFEADESYPVILSSAGHLMDGGHRISKAWLVGRTEILAVQFETDPETDWIVTT